jgi:uncharacterized protein (TIGR03437 family)
MSVTLNGTHFGTSQGTVTFNGINASITNWTDNVVSAVVPAGLSTGTATITVAVAGLGSNGVSFTVTQPLFVTPNQVSMLVGTTRFMQVTDENGVILTTRGALPIPQ